MAEILKWLEREGFEEYSELFTSELIDLDVLHDLDDADLEKLGIPLGDRKRILKAIRSTLSQQGEDKESDQLRQSTFVFADLVDSTSISERLDTEEYRSLIERVQDVYARIIEDEHKGEINDYQGDGIFACFGRKKAREDDAERAVAAGLSIVSEIPKLDSGLDETLHVRVGIETGPALKGGHNTMMGTHPNLASKIQKLAEPDTVLISDITKRLLGRQFVCEDLGEQDIVGLSEPRKIWRVKEQTLVNTRFEARHSGNLTNYVGHEYEVAQLKQLWEQCLDTDRNHTAEGQVVLIIGEAGIGKSRLTQVLCEHVQEDHTILQYQCSPHHMDSALHPIIMQLTVQAGLEPGDRSEDKLEKLASLFGEVDHAGSDVLSIFAHLFAITSGIATDLKDKPPEHIKELTLETLLDLWVTRANHKPLLIVFEDLQWIDPTSQELLYRLVSRVKDLECMVLATYRDDEYDSQWEGEVNVTTLKLGKLNQNQSRALIRQQTTGRELPDQIMETIIKKTDGVPLFLEEVTKSALESKSLGAGDDSDVLRENSSQFTIPAILVESLKVRLDRLPAALEIAPYGATIGRTFSYSLLAAVSKLDPDKLKSGLDQLIEAQLLFEHGCIPDSSYTFKHALVQDYAYESQVGSIRKLVHKEIAETLSSEEDTVGRSRPEDIAFHYQKAGKLDKAFGFWIKAGENGLEAGATTETVKLLNNSKKYLSQTDQDKPNRPDRYKYFILRGKALNASKGARSKEAEDDFWEAAKIAERMPDPKDQVHALDSVFGIIFNSGDTNRSIGPAQAMIQVGEDRDYPIGTKGGEQSMGMVMFTRGEFVQARKHLEKAIEDSEKYKAGINSYPSLALMYLAWTQYILGDKASGLQYCKDSIESGENEIPYSHAVSLGNSCYLYQFANDLNNLEHNANKLLELAQSKGQLIWLSRGLFFKHWLEANRDKNVDALGLMEKEVKKLLDACEEIEVTYYLGLVAETQLNLGRFEDASRSLDLADRLVKKNGEKFYEAELLRIRGDLLCQTGVGNGGEDPETYYRESLEVAEKQSAELWIEKVSSRLELMA